MTIDKLEPKIEKLIERVQAATRLPFQNHKLAREADSQIKRILFELLEGFLEHAEQDWETGDGHSEEENS